MGFAGNLRTLSLPEVVQTLTRIQATGVLRLARSDGKCDVIFREGQIIGVSARDGGERQAILSRMIMDGQLDAEAAATLSASGSESQVVEALISNHHVSDEQVRQARQLQAEEYLHDVCTWEAADFVFLDASPDEPEATALVQKHAELGLHFNTNTLLMEAARRMDEWTRIHEKLPQGTYVLGVAAGMDQALAEAGADYPGMAVAPLVDAIRTIDDIVRDAVVPRLEVYQVLEELLERGVICALNREDILAHADYWHEQQKYELAARLYRRALAYDSKDKAAFAKLGSCLEFLGDGKEAAACYSQMAIGLLEDGDYSRALEYARHAVGLQPTEAGLRLTQARCHLMTGDDVGAVSELREVVQIYIAAGQLEDARGTCLKILDLSKTDEFARRELARIFSRVEHDQQSEDVIACIQCGTVNHREATTCTACQASLQLSCLACGRVVAVSDHLCIFCGADPHAGAGNRRAGGNATTSRIVRRGDQKRAPSPHIAAAAQEASAPKSNEKGTAYWREQLERNLKAAQAHEEAGHLEEALAAWREVAKVQIDRPDIVVHIKELEIQLNQASIERNIEYGHAQRRTRHYWRATRAYRDALRAMASDDPRLAPVQDILAKTERDQRRITVIYGASGAVLLCLGILAARPYLQSRSFQADSSQASARIEELPRVSPLSAGEQLRAIDQTVETLAEDAERIRGALGTAAKARVGEIRSALFSARTQLATGLLVQLETAVRDGRAVEAEQMVTVFTQDFGGGILPDRLARAKDGLTVLKKQLRMRDDESKVAPQRLEAARTFEKEGRLGDALAIFKELSTSANLDVATEAGQALRRLTPAEVAAGELWSRVTALPANDLKGGREALASDEVVRMAQAWNHEGDRLRLLKECDLRLQAAAESFAALGPEPVPAKVQAFLATHGTAPEAARAKALLVQSQARSEAKDRALALYRTHMDARRWAEAWQSGRDLVGAYESLLVPGQVALPQVIESSPPGAIVTWKGREIGKTPLVLTYAPGDDGDLSLHLLGWKPLAVRLSGIAEDWRWLGTLVRTESWKIELGRGIDGLSLLPDHRCLAMVGDGLALMDGRGTLVWRHAMGSDDLGGGRAHLAHAPLLLPDGRFLIGLPGRDALLLDSTGNPVARIDTEAEVRGRPHLYTNDAYGAQPRVAFAGDRLYTGPVGGEFARIPLPAPAMSGPASVDRGLDRVLVMILVDGRMIGIEESTRVQPWPALPLQASEAGQMIPAGPGLVAVILDGSRLAMIRLTSDGATVAWTQALKGSAVGDPVINGTTLGIASGSQVARFGINGSALATIPLPSPASSAPALDGEVGAVGCQDGQLVLWKGDRIAWATACGSPVTSVALLPGQVVAGLADGRILGFSR
jgi:tetratricopeptide (TPR) repeat protein